MQPIRAELPAMRYSRRESLLDFANDLIRAKKLQVSATDYSDGITLDDGTTRYGGLNSFATIRKILSGWPQ